MCCVKRFSLIAVPLYSLLGTICCPNSTRNPAFAEEPIPVSVITKLPSVLTVQDAIDITFKDGPQQTLVRANLAAALAERTESLSGYYPSVTSSYGLQFTRISNYGLAQNRDAVFSSPPGVPTVNAAGDNTTDAQGGTTSIVLSQRIFDTGQRELLNAEARQHVESASLTMEDVGEQRIDNVITAFYQLLESEDFVKVAQAAVSENQLILADSEALTPNAGDATSDEQQALASLGLAKVELIRCQNQAQLDSVSLVNAMGIVTNDPVRPMTLGTYDIVPPAPTPATLQTCEQYDTLAQNNRKDLLAQLMNVDEARDAVKTARISAGVSLSADYLLVYQPQNDTGPRGSYSLLTLTAAYPLLDGGLSRGAVRDADAELEAAIATFEIDRQAIIEEVQQAYSNREDSISEISTAQQTLSSAEANNAQALSLYQNGKGTIVSVSLAESTLTQARGQYVAAVYNYYVANSELSRSAGLIPLPS